jgi:hypothetical protein
VVIGTSAALFWKKAASNAAQETTKQSRLHQNAPASDPDTLTRNVELKGGVGDEEVGGNPFQRHTIRWSSPIEPPEMGRERVSRRERKQMVGPLSQSSKGRFEI